MGFEDQLNKTVFSAKSERTFIDKLLAKDDVKAIQELIKKPKLTRSELLEILYLISGTEAKLLNYSEWDRYVILKFFVWIREFIKTAELLYDYQDDLKERESLGVVVLTDRTKKFIENNRRLCEHNAKFLIDLYLNIGRTSLSIGATGIMEMLKNRYEMNYNYPNPQNNPQNKGGFSVLGTGGKNNA